MEDNDGQGWRKAGVEDGERNNVRMFEMVWLQFSSDTAISTEFSSLLYFHVLLTFDHVA